MAPQAPEPRPSPSGLGSTREAQGLLPTLATPESGVVTDLGSAPTMASDELPESHPATVLGEAPIWKRVLWYLLALPLAWGLMPAAPELSETADQWLFGLGDSMPSWLIYLFLATVCSGLTVAAVLTERMWNRREFNSWLHGRGFIAFPIVGLLVTIRFHAVLGAQIDAALASFRSYLQIGPRQAHEIVGLLTTALTNYLNTEALLLGLLSLLTVSTLLGYVFAQPSGGADRSRKSYLRWLVLPGGGGLVLLAEFVLFPDLISMLGPWRFVIYLVWVLAAIPVIRERSPAARSYTLGWRAIFAGIVAAVAVEQLAGTAGLMMIYVGFDGVPADQRAVMATRAGETMGEAMVVMQGLVTVLMAGLIAVNWRWLGGPGAFGWKTPGKWIAWTLATLLCMTAPYLGLVLGNIEARDALMMPAGSPGIVQMLPGILDGETEASFYIDQYAASLGKSREQFFARLTGKEDVDFDREELLGVLAGSQQCKDVLTHSLERPGDGKTAVPAVCISAIEARLYCEARRKRLPTPQEWAATAGALAPGESREDGRLSRGPFGEWTMKVIHGNPAFEVAGLPHGVDELPTAGPETFSPNIGFRCVYRFDE